MSLPGSWASRRDRGRTRHAGQASSVCPSPPWARPCPPWHGSGCRSWGLASAPASPQATAGGLWPCGRQPSSPEPRAPRSLHPLADESGLQPAGLHHGCRVVWVGGSGGGQGGAQLGWPALSPATLARPDQAPRPHPRRPHLRSRWCAPPRMVMASTEALRLLRIYRWRRLCWGRVLWAEPPAPQLLVRAGRMWPPQRLEESGSIIKER